MILLPMTKNFQNFLKKNTSQYVHELYLYKKFISFISHQFIPILCWAIYDRFTKKIKVSNWRRGLMNYLEDIQYTIKKQCFKNFLTILKSNIYF